MTDVETVFVPYTRINPPTIDALRRWRPVMWWVGGDPNEYLRYFRTRWLDTRTFINVEHDVIPTDAQIQGLYDCPQEWCCFTEYEGGPPTLSLARFRPGFMWANRNIWQAIDMRTARQPTWTLLDSWLVAHADRAPHLHPGFVKNTRPWGTLHEV